MKRVLDEDRWRVVDVQTGVKMKSRASLAPLNKRRLKARLAVVTRHRPGHARPCNTPIFMTMVQADKDDLEGACVTSAVVTAGHGAEHRAPIAVVHQGGRLQLPPAARHGVPNDERHGSIGHFANENAAMTAVQRSVAQPVVVGDARTKFGGGEKVWDVIFRLRAGVEVEGIKEAQHGGSSVVLVVAAAESSAGEEAEPALAGEGGAHEVLGLVRRKAEEDLLEELVQQRRRRRRH
uniref:Uncharacterized protein n=1 Tax=Triticum urartu TaxID=4572 RepID=A0A8R7RA24_TRIUA